MPSSGVQHTVDLQFDIHISHSIHIKFLKNNTLPIQLRGPALNGM